VPRPNASGGEHLSRGRIPPSPRRLLEIILNFTILFLCLSLSLGRF
jgi:hypothetical protein